MADNKFLVELTARLKAKNIFDLRQVARQVGVPRPTEGKKERLIEGILDIASGRADPAAQSAIGAPPKSNNYDRQLVVDIMRCRELSLNEVEVEGTGGIKMQVASSEAEEQTEGLLFKNDGAWYLNSPSGECVFVSDSFASRFNLRTGDYIKGTLRRKSTVSLAGLASIVSVNGVLPDALANRLNFEELTPVYPAKSFKTARGQNDVTGRLIDLISPVAAGQRAFVVSPRGTGKTSVLKTIASGIEQNNPEVKIIILLVDARPEEAVDFKRVFTRADVLASTADAGAQIHVNTADLALEYAKRQVELSRDVVLIVDNLTKLTRAYNSCSQVTTSLDASALDKAKKFISSARNTESGASLTVIAALTSEGDPLEEAIYSGIKDVCNMRITLSRRLAVQRVYPPIDVENTYALHDEKFLSESELDAAVALRAKSDEGVLKILELIRKTSSNAELCSLLNGKN